MNNVSLIYGPPGTGKTTTLLSSVEELLKQGIQPQDIGFVAFTRKAANEAKSRAMEKFELSPEQLPWFRTLHSFAFQQLGVKKQDLLGLRDYFEMANLLGLRLTCKGVSEDGTISGLSKGDRLFFMENQARTMGQPLRQYWESRPNEDIYWHELELVANTVKKYKEEHSKKDFTDIIDEFITLGESPRFHTLVIDEAQDLSPKQWEMVEKLSACADNTLIAGDDDQAIFRWAGADVDKFINLPGFSIVLPQSYRVPAAIQKVADNVISRVQSRVEKVWKPRKGDKGRVEHVNSVDQIDMSKGTWLLLGRNLFLLEQYVNYCVSQGYLFDAPIGSPIQAKSREAIHTWNTLLTGGKATVSRIRNMYELMSSRGRITYGSKKKLDAIADSAWLTMYDLVNNYGLLNPKYTWEEALDKLPDTERVYFTTAFKNGEEMKLEPRIRIATIHSVKGGEADNVVICPDMALRTYNEYIEKPDDEHRVWYVAITRAKEALYLLTPQLANSYEI